MNAEDFYEEFKEALKYLGPGWFEKEKIQVRVKKEKFILKFGQLETSISLSADKKKGKN